MTTLTYQHVFHPGTDPSAPPLLLLHGTGGDEHDLVPLARRLSPGSALLSPRGDVLERGAPRFFARLAEGVFDLEEVRRRTHALADFVEGAGRRYEIDRSRLLAVGFSNGANIAASLLLLRPESLAGAVLLRAMVVLGDQPQPGSLAGKRVLLTNGAHDPIIPADHSARLAAQLRAGGAEVRAHLFPASHALIPADVEAAQTFVSLR